MQSCIRFWRCALQCGGWRDVTCESEDQFERELDLARIAGCPADFAEAGTFDDIGRQPEIHNVEQVEKLCPELQIHQFALTAPPEGYIFDEREIEIVKARSTKGIAA